MRAVLLTSDFPRHRWVASALAARLDLVGVWMEAKTFRPERHAGSEEDLRVITAHFAARDASEIRYFGNQAEPSLSAGATCRRVPPSGCNDPDEVAKIRELRPDVGLVFGTGILKAPLIEAFGGSLINIHLGLSPYYRGSGTNFWPLVNREPEYVGATIHYIDEGIDTGPMLAHVRPEVDPEDGPHDLGNKTIIAAAAVLARAAELHLAGRLRGVPQAGGGRVYYRRDFNADAVRRLTANMETGMIPEYLADRGRRDRALALLALPVV